MAAVDPDDELSLAAVGFDSNPLITKGACGANAPLADGSDPPSDSNPSSAKGANHVDAPFADVSDPPPKPNNKWLPRFDVATFS